MLYMYFIYCQFVLYLCIYENKVILPNTFNDILEKMSDVVLHITEHITVHITEKY